MPTSTDCPSAIIMSKLLLLRSLVLCVHFKYIYNHCIAIIKNKYLSPGFEMLTLVMSKLELPKNEYK